MPNPPIPSNKQGEKPKRIQLRRTKGWKMPPNTVSVAPPSRYGNPFRVGWYATEVAAPKAFVNGAPVGFPYSVGPQKFNPNATLIVDAADAVRRFRDYIEKEGGEIKWEWISAQPTTQPETSP